MATYDELANLAVLAEAKEKRAYDKYVRLKEAARVARADAQAAKRPPEPMTFGSVVTFTKFFNGTRAYNYAAIKSTSAKWSVTGRGNLTEVSWAQLMAFVAKDEASEQGAYKTLRYAPILEPLG